MIYSQNSVFTKLHFFLNFIDQKDKTSMLQIWAKNKHNAYGVAPNTNYNNNKDIIDQYAY